MVEFLIVLLCVLIIRGCCRAIKREQRKAERKEAARRHREELIEQRREEHQIWKQIKKQEKEQKKEEKRRMSCKFDRGVSFEEFEGLVLLAKKQLKIKRLKELSIKGSDVFGRVVSESSNSDWYFVIHFNDHGHMTGRYQLESDNKQSKIPRRFAEKVSELISEKRRMKN